MFLFLHRLLKTLLCACWLGVAWLGWRERERLLPAWDFIQVWVERDTGSQPTAVRLTGTVSDVTSGTTFHLRETDGRTWHCGLLGLSGTSPPTRPATAPEQRLDRSNRTNLVALLTGRPIVFQATTTSPLLTALGTAQLNGTNFSVSVVAEGRAGLDRSAIRVLPVMDQYQLVAAERRARKAKAGRWSLDAPAAQNSSASR